MQEGSIGQDCGSALDCRTRAWLKSVALERAGFAVFQRHDGSCGRQRNAVFRPPRVWMTSIQLFESLHRSRGCGFRLSGISLRPSAALTRSSIITPSSTFLSVFQTMTALECFGRLCMTVTYTQRWHAHLGKACKWAGDPVQQRNRTQSVSVSPHGRCRQRRVYLGVRDREVESPA